MRFRLADDKVLERFREGLWTYLQSGALDGSWDEDSGKLIVNSAPSSFYVFNKVYYFDPGNYVEEKGRQPHKM